jgi:SAM-dependent methyltransferase
MAADDLSASIGGKKNFLAGGVLGLAVAALYSLAIYEFAVPHAAPDKRSIELIIFSLSVGTALLVLLRVELRGGRLTKIKLKWFEAHFTRDALPQRKLQEDERARRELELNEFLRENNDRQLPGSDAPQYDVLGGGSAADLLVRPSAYPETPMYMLDKDFRIVDWNEAFSLAFDKTMDGRIGESVLEWTYFLDNFQEVLDHGTKVFGKTVKFPRIDVETVRYTSLSYGTFDAVKRAYQIPDDEERVLAWLITMDLKFPQRETAESYRRDLIRLLSLEQLWSEYALSYDMILNKTRIYPQLLTEMIGEMGPLPVISADARVLDLGAGTGNLALKLMAGRTSRLVMAVEKNRTMLEHLRLRCGQYLRDDDDGPGIVVRKQDVARLHGLREDYFDYALLNNVLYAVEDAKNCLRSVHRVLKPGGEIRISGPHRDSDPDRLFAQIRKELVTAGAFERLEVAFEDAYHINKFRLRHLLHRWTVEDMLALLTDQGLFEVLNVSREVYAGQSVLITARKVGRT